MPSQMLRYRAAAFWQRVYCPEISMGLITKEEAEDIQDVEYTEIPDTGNLQKMAEKAAGVIEDNQEESPAVKQDGENQENKQRKSLL